jgi:UDP-glucuronate 4-epimerase
MVTGCAGFIGFHTAARLLSEGHVVCGVDNLNELNEPSLKRARLAQLLNRPGFTFARADVADGAAVRQLVEGAQPQGVIHLAAQTGVRYSVENPRAYTDSNLVGFSNVLEACAHAKVSHLVYASSSSVYGASGKVPFSEEDGVDHPLSYYAATKKANELMAHAYSHIHKLPTSGLRFFTVYGPWGRPDMAPILFARAIRRGQPIQLFNQGRMRRDFTYVDDVVEGLARVLALPPEASAQAAPYRILNVGNSHPVELEEFVAILERHLGRKAERVLLPMQLGDVPATWADTSRLEALTGFAPRTSLEEGLGRMAAWLSSYETALGEPS